MSRCACQTLPRSDCATTEYCQLACKPGSVWRLPSATAIHLGLGSLPASSNQPGRRPGSRLSLELPPRPCRPYSVLLPVGFAVPPPLPETRCALTAPFHPYPSCGVAPAIRAVCFLLHFPWGRPRRPLAVTVDPWSPDFPPPVARQWPSGQLAPAIRAPLGRWSRGQEGQIRNLPPPSPRRWRGRRRQRGGRSGSAGWC